ncbi:hypothetical protein [Nocardia sp. bgisy134]|uniref:hypothetical protein n=1 Tax=unclassified Nocardia TaxID=2637762 RepID=UPI003D75972E
MYPLTRSTKERTSGSVPEYASGKKSEVGRITGVRSVLGPNCAAHQLNISSTHSRSISPTGHVGLKNPMRHYLWRLEAPRRCAIRSGSVTGRRWCTAGPSPMTVVEYVDGSVIRHQTELTAFSTTSEHSTGEYPATMNP